MKKVAVVFLMAILPVFGFSQSVFDKYENMDNVGSVIVNKGMIDLVSKFGDMSDDAEAQGVYGDSKRIKKCKGVYDRRCLGFCRHGFNGKEIPEIF